MTESRGVLLDMPFVAALAHSPEFCVTRPWGAYPALIHDSPRYLRLDTLKSEALEALLLFEKILLPDIFVRLYDRDDSGRIVLVGREFGELQNLAREDHISFVEPAIEDAFNPPPFDSEFARSAKHILWADACRDLGREEGMRSWEYDFLVDLLTSDEEREFESFLLTLPEAAAELDSSLHWILEREVSGGTESQYSTFTDLVSGQVRGRRRHSKDMKKHKREFLRLIVAVYRSFDREGRLRGWSNTEILALEHKRVTLKWSYARITQLLRMAAERDVGLKLEAPLDVQGPSQDRNDVRLEGTGLAILPVIMDEIQRFPRIDSVADLKKHLGKRYVTNLREALLQWKEALLIGSIKDEQALRSEIRRCADAAIKKVGRWRATGSTLTVTSLVSGGLSLSSALSWLFGPVSLLTGAAALGAQWRERAVREKKGWLLFGSER